MALKVTTNRKKIGSLRKKSTLKTNSSGLIEIASEHDLQKACVAKLRNHNMLCFNTDVFNGISFIKDIPGKAIYKQHMIAMGARVGQPDLIVLHDQKCTFVEFKWKKGKKSAEQEFVCDQLQKAGYEVLEWRILEDCENWIIEQLKEKQEVKE